MKIFKQILAMLVLILLGILSIPLSFIYFIVGGTVVALHMLFTGEDIIDQMIEHNPTAMVVKLFKYLVD